jgi:hypothetical protein
MFQLSVFLKLGSSDFDAISSQGLGGKSRGRVSFGICTFSRKDVFDITLIEKL